MPERLIDAYLPVFDVAVTEHLVIDADPDRVFAATRDLDFMTVRSPLLSAAFFVRGLPSRLPGRSTPAPEALRLGAGQVALPGWSYLGQDPGTEICFGAVGKFWLPDIEWRDVPVEQFASFAEPGWGKLACQLRVRPDGPHRSVLSYECRTATTDAAARRRMARYWTVIRPFVGHVMRATLHTVAIGVTAGDGRVPAGQAGTARNGLPG